MYNLIKNIFIGIVLLVLLVLFSVHYALNSESIMRDACVRFLESKYEDIDIETFVLGRSRFIYPLNFLLEDVECEFSFKGQKGRIAFDNLIFFVKDIFDNDVKNLVISADDLSLRLMNVEINGLNVFMNSFIEGKAEKVTFLSEVDMRSVQFKEYNMSSIKFKMDFDGKKVNVDDFAANFYGGELSGAGEIETTPEQNFAVKLDMSEINLYELAEVNPDLFSYVCAKINGSAEIVGNKKSLESLNLNMESTDQAMMKASLLKQLLFIVSENLGKDITRLMRTDDNKPVSQALEELIKIDGSVPLTQMKIKSETESRDKIHTLVSFESDKFNLNIDSLTIDANIDGGYQSLLRFLK